MTVLALALLAAPAIALRSRIAILPGLYLAVFYVLMGTLGAVAWNWSRDTNGAGLPSVFAANPSMSGLGTTVFLTAAVGALLGGVLAALCLQTRFSSRGIKAALTNRRVVLGAQVTSASMLLLWAAGQGPNLIIRDEYLLTNGVDFLLKAVSLLGPLTGVGALFISAFTQSRAIRLAALLLATLWWCLTLSVPMIAIVIIFAQMDRSRPGPTLLRFATGAPLLAYVTLSTFTVTSVVRGRPHGVLRLAELFSDPSVPVLLQADTWLDPVKRLVSSITAAAPLTEQSALHPPSASVLLGNLNPLPSALLNIDAFSFERLWPYFWVPLGFLGEWFGAFGSLGMILLLALVAFSAGIGCAMLQRRQMSVGIVLMFVLIVAMSFVTAQYPSRSSGRVISFVVFLPAAILALELFVRTVRSSARSNRGSPTPRELLWPDEAPVDKRVRHVRERDGRTLTVHERLS